MDDFDRAVVQILMARGMIEDNELRQICVALERDFPNGITGGSLPAMFRRINQQLKLLLLEVKTVVSVEESNQLQHHSIVNNESDTVAKEHGSSLLDYELEYLKIIIENLIENDYMSSMELVKLRKTEKMNGLEATGFINKVISQYWLKRNDRNYIEIGLRSQLELRDFIESCIRGEDGEDNPIIEGKISKLPQIVYY